ncbi:HAD domain-containing protein [Curtobacterium sp. MCSS17_016]|uniref:HAD domain-containing protein n=1 Tax=Curtobacterium sp. MCSS17_016 TaxID=2175644 RepID=UPI000DAA2FAC|nr:HAD domain-containing protein [Curtobacterium sp. MCSS17_016]WIE81075.1 HAD domain-containing protein [Curtobacterium sp. MCSS17_016]
MLQPVLYLDVDDVICADYADRVWAGGTTTVEFVQKYPGGFGMLRRVTFADALVRALGQIVDDFDVELVWDTSWCEDLLVTRKLVPKFGGALMGGRVAQYPYGEDGEDGAWKRDFVLSDQHGDPRPFVWVDDTEVPAHGDTVRRLTAPTTSLLLAPEANIGLTPSHVELIREFFSAVS